MEFGYCCSEHAVGRENPLAMVSSWNERGTETERERMSKSENNSKNLEKETGA
jgi:hypothetical protein